MKLSANTSPDLVGFVLLRRTARQASISAVPLLPPRPGEQRASGCRGTAEQVHRAAANPTETGPRSRRHPTAAGTGTPRLPDTTPPRRPAAGLRGAAGPARGGRRRSRASWAARARPPPAFLPSPSPPSLPPPAGEAGPTCAPPEPPPAAAG